MTETAPVVLVAVDDRIATVTLNRPEARNALNRAPSSRCGTPSPPPGPTRTSMR